MKVIISPAKKMNVEPELYPYREVPQFLAEASELAEWIRALTYEEQRSSGNAMTPLPVRIMRGFRR